MLSEQDKLDIKVGSIVRIATDVPIDGRLDFYKEGYGRIVFRVKNINSAGAVELSSSCYYGSRFIPLDHPQLELLFP